MLNVSVWPSGSDAIGVKSYAWPAITDLPGVPLIDGGWFDGGADMTACVTVTEKAGSEVLYLPSPTQIPIFE